MIEIWQASLDVSPPRQVALAALLSADETAKASRYHFQADQRRYIAARGTLRELLGRYLNQNPATVEFVYGAFGKPSLKSSPVNNAPPLFFNLAHSDEAALYAVTRIGPIGIDLERIRPDFEIANIVAHFFAPEEAAILSQLPAPARNKRFFRYWTRKEAYCKALGDGFTLDPKRMNASAALASPADWFSLNWDGSPDARISLCDLEMDTRYAAALAITEKTTPIIMREWDEN